MSEQKRCKRIPIEIKLKTDIEKVREQIQNIE